MTSLSFVRQISEKYVYEVLKIKSSFSKQSSDLLWSLLPSCSTLFIWKLGVSHVLGGCHFTQPWANIGAETLKYPSCDYVLPVFILCFF